TCRSSDRRLGERVVAREPAPRVGVRKEFGQMLEEFGVHRDDRGDGRGAYLFLIPRNGERGELLLRFVRHTPDDPRRQAVRAGRAELHQVPDRAQLLFGDRTVEIAIISARGTKQLVESAVGKRLAHGLTPELDWSDGVNCRYLGNIMFQE